MGGETDTIVIGAGPAGLAVGAALRARNVPFMMLERHDRVGSSWYGHYDRLHLHTPKGHSALPFLDYPRTYPRYPSRDQFIAYLDAYARAFDIQPHFGQDVVRCTPTASDGWEVETQATTWRARHLVVATGVSRVPCMPGHPGRDSFAGTILHSRDYLNGKSFRDKRVLVVGFGNSGAEIALDLWEHGAQPSISARGEVNVIPREVLGIPVTQLALAGRHLPTRMADRVNALMIRLAIGDLTRHGIRKRPDGPFVEVLEHRQVPVIDVGTVALIKRGLVQMRPAITRFDHAEVCFADGRRESYDAAILATGFRTGLQSLLPDNLALLDAAGYPRALGPTASTPGLYFCGFNLVPTGLLREIALDALRIAAQIGEARCQ
jgi:cation diffusion facilitator CzcD-associated flavoprotein CzcO